jgi:hypothetical protein
MRVTAAAALMTSAAPIERHAGQAVPVTARFKALSAADQALPLRFLDSP